MPVEYRSDGGITSSPAIGLIDWRSRLKSENTSTNIEIKEQVLVNTSTGDFSQVVFAVRLNPANIPAANTLDVQFLQKADAPKASRQFVYRLENTFSTVSGVEAGLEKKTLRYSNTDTVQVYLNGIELSNGALPENYELYNGGANGVLPNVIEFNTPISLPGISQVDVVVSPVQTSTSVQTTFDVNIADESRINSGAWENVQFVEHFNGTAVQRYYLFRMDLTNASFNLNSLMIVQRVRLNGTIDYDLQDVFMLLSRAPFSQVDRYTNCWVPLSNLNFSTSYFKFSAVNGEQVLNILEPSIQSVYPTFKVSKFEQEQTIKTSLEGVQNQIVLDRTTIVGPDS